MTKVISLSDEAYNSLKSLKKEGESFSKVVNRLSAEGKKKSWDELFGKWSGSKKELDNITRDIYADRKKFRIREVKF